MRLPKCHPPPRNKALLRDDKQPLSLNKAFFGPYVLGGGPIGGPLRFPWKFGWMAPHLIFQNLNQSKYRAWGRPLNTTLRQDKWHLLNNNLWISWVGSQRKKQVYLNKNPEKENRKVLNIQFSLTKTWDTNWLTKYHEMIPAYFLLVMCICHVFLF